MQTVQNENLNLLPVFKIKDSQSGGDIECQARHSGCVCLFYECLCLRSSYACNCAIPGNVYPRLAKSTGMVLGSFEIL